MKKHQKHFLFPSHPLNPKRPDETFSDQIEAFMAAGYTVSLCPDAVIEGTQPLRGVPVGSEVIYRGWMLDAVGYKHLEEAINAAPSQLLTSLDSYLAAHYLPRWYDKLQDLTPETVVLAAGSEYETELKKLGWDGYFIKDFVKSITTSSGSIIHRPEQINQVIQTFIDYRGELEGGLCVRRVEPLIESTEQRYFVVEGTPHSKDDAAVPGIVNEVVDRIHLPFYSVDVIQRTDGELRVVEIGDGQVSDLKNWSAESFARIWRLSESAR